MIDWLFFWAGSQELPYTLIEVCRLLTGQSLQGSVVFREVQTVKVKHSADGKAVMREKALPRVVHEDIISRSFWEAHPEILR